jgi:hypothetical protein
MKTSTEKKELVVFASIKHRIYAFTDEKNESKKTEIMEEIKKSVDSIEEMKDMSIVIMGQQSETVKIVGRTAEMQREQINKLKAQIKELEALKDVRYTNLSFDEVEAIAFNSNTPDKAAKQYQKVLARANKLKETSGLDVQFVLSSTGVIKAKILMKSK